MGRFKKISAVMLSFVIIILLISCNDLADKNLTTDSQIEKQKDIEKNEPTQGIEDLEPVLTLDEALTIFFETFEKKSINLYEIEFKTDKREDYRYFIKGWDSNYTYTLELDVETADIIKKERKNNKKINGVLDLDAAITPKKAMDVAVSETKEEAVTNWRLIEENNQMIYQIGFASGKNQRVNAIDGELLNRK